MQLLIRFLLLFFFITISLCAEDYYNLLGISKTASDREIKKAYRNLSKRYHPDKNPGDEAAAAKFVEIADAYEALSNSETRGIYDKYGHEGLKQHKQSSGRGGGRSHDPFDLFSRFFGGGGHFGGGERRGPNMEFKVAIPLRDFYNGLQMEFNVEKQMICDKCEGSGSQDGKVDQCNTCGGRGMTVQKHMLAPGIFQQMQQVCQACGGKGTTVRHKCKTCGGQRVVRQSETHDLHVARGTAKGQRVQYENEADESPDYVAGDLIVTLIEKEPQLGSGDNDRTDGTFFRRKDDSLFWREVLSLREAWLGDWTRNVTHLDGHVVRLSRKRGEVVQPNTVEVIEGEGMPIFNSDSDTGKLSFGHLHVEYTVVFPDKMESGMEKEFWAVWEKWRKKNGVDLHKDSGRPAPKQHDEL